MAMSKKPSGGSRGRMASKTTINFAANEKKQSNVSAIVPIILVIVALGALAGKFLIYDRLQEVKKAKAETEDLQAQVDAANETIKGFGELAIEFAHYTYSGMTDEEVTRTDRMAMLKVIDKDVRDRCTVNNWQIYGNTMKISVIAKDRTTVTRVKRLLEQEPEVSTCSVLSTKAGFDNDGAAITTANYLIVFWPKEKEVQAG